MVQDVEGPKGPRDGQGLVQWHPGSRKPRRWSLDISFPFLHDYVATFLYLSEGEQL